jgi:hypothetical protein
MAETTNPAGDPAAGGTIAPAGTMPTTGAPGGTPSPAAGEPAGGGDVEHWKAEAKKAFVKRDRALEEFKGSDEFKAIAAKAAKADEYATAQAEATRKAAEEQGKWKELYEAEKGKTEAAVKAIAEERDKLRQGRIRESLAGAYTAAGGVDKDTFLELAAKHIAAGEIGVGDDGAVKGVAEVVEKFRAGKPYLFKAGGGSTIPGGPGAGTTGDVSKLLLGKRGSLAEGPVLSTEQRKAYMDQLPK